MSTSLVFGVLIAVGVIALLVAAGLLSNSRQPTAKQEPLVQEPAESRELARVNGARPLPPEQTAAPMYSRTNGQRNPQAGTLQRDRERAQDRQEDLQARYEQTLQELMTLLQQEQRPPSSKISLEEEDDPYRATPRLQRQIDDAPPSAHLERSVISSQPLSKPETTEVQADYSLVPNDEEARKKLPSGLSIPVSITLDGDVELEHVPRMRIDIVIHLQ